MLITYELIIAKQYLPYFLDYFNEFVGGPANANARGFPVGYWGEGVKETVDYLNSKAPNGATLRFAVAQPNIIPKIRSDIKVLKPFIHTSYQQFTREEDYEKKLEENTLSEYILLYDLGVPDLDLYYNEIYASQIQGRKLAKLYQLKPGISK